MNNIYDTQKKLATELVRMAGDDLFRGTKLSLMFCQEVACPAVELLMSDADKVELAGTPQALVYDESWTGPVGAHTAETCLDQIYEARKVKKALEELLGEIPATILLEDMFPVNLANRLTVGCFTEFVKDVVEHVEVWSGDSYGFGRYPKNVHKVLKSEIGFAEGMITGIAALADKLRTTNRPGNDKYLENLQHTLDDYKDRLHQASIEIDGLCA